MQLQFKPQSEEKNCTNFYVEVEPDYYFGDLFFDEGIWYYHPCIENAELIELDAKNLKDAKKETHQHIIAQYKSNIKIAEQIIQELKL